jgi:hypothetical protein
MHHTFRVAAPPAGRCGLAWALTLWTTACGSRTGLVDGVSPRSMLDAQADATIEAAATCTACDARDPLPPTGSPTDPNGFV